MQVLVLYYSKGGNTRKLAERIGEGIESVSGVKALLKSTQEVKKEDFVDSAGDGMIVVGDPMDATGHYGVACVGAPDEKMSDNARKLGRRVA